jgi:hypothetical protein
MSADHTPNPAPPRPWFAPGLGEVIFLVAVVFVLRGSRHGLLDDPGLGWHLRNIDAMRAAGGWLREDPFTQTHGRPPAEWYTNQWLGELPLWLGWRYAGLEGIAVVTAVVVGLTGRCLYAYLLRDGLTWPAALLWTTLGMVGTSVSWNARPNVFTILFVLITARACAWLAGETAAGGPAADRGGVLPPPRVWLLVGLFVVWANVHGGFVAGLILLTLATLVEAARCVGSLTPRAREAAGRGAARLGLVTAGCLLGTLVNPYGPWLYRWVFLLLGDPFYMELHQEWRAPDFRGGAIRYELLMLLFPLVLALTARRPGLVELGLSVAWLHLALTGFRYVPLWVVVSTPLMARSSVAIPYLRGLAARLGLHAGPGSLFATRPERGPWVWTAALATGLFAAAPLLQGKVSGHGKDVLATQELDRFLEVCRRWREQHGRPPVVFHSYDWGGYLTWHGWPAVRNWIDDRNEVQGKEHIEAYFSILKAEPGWEAKLADVNLICIESEAPLTRALRHSRRWRQIWPGPGDPQDAPAVLFERAGR